MRVGTIGSGAIVHRFSQAAAECGDACIHAVFSRSIRRARELAADYGTGAGAERTVELGRRGYNMVYELETFAEGDADLIAWSQEVTLAALSVTDRIRRLTGVAFPTD